MDSYNLLDDKYGLENLEIKIKVNPDVVNFIGEGYFLGSNVNFEGESNYERG